MMPARDTSISAARTVAAAARARLARVRRDDWLAALVLLLALLLRLNHLGAPSNDYDTGVYVESLRALLAGNPLYHTIYYAQPPLFLYILLPWYALLGQSLVAARIGVVAYSLVGLVAAWWLARGLGGRRAGLIALALLAFDPLYLTQSRSVQAEAPALACALVALAVARGARGSWRVPLAGALFAASMLIKLFTLPAIIPVAYLLLAPICGSEIERLILARRWPTREKLRALWRASRVTVLGAIAGAAFVTGLAFLPSIGWMGDAWSQIIGLHVTATGAAHQSLGDRLGLFGQSWFELPLVAVGLAAGVAGWRQRRWTAVMLAAWGVASIAVLLIQDPLFSHHLALIAPSFTLAAAEWVALASAPQRASGAPPRPAIDVGLASSIALAVTLVVALASGVVQQNAALSASTTTIQTAAGDLDLFTQPGDVIVTDDQIVAVLANRAVPPQLADTSMVRIAAGALTTAQVIAAASNPHVTAVLWLAGRFDALPGLRSWVEAHFYRVASYSAGAALYLRRPSTPPTG